MLGQINSTPRSVLSRTGVTWRVWRKRKDSKIRKSCTYDNLSFLFHSLGGGFQTFLLTLLQDAQVIWWTRNGMLKRGFLLVASRSMSRALDRIELNVLDILCSVRRLPWLWHKTVPHQSLAQVLRLFCTKTEHLSQTESLEKTRSFFLALETLQTYLSTSCDLKDSRKPESRTWALWLEHVKLLVAKTSDFPPCNLTVGMDGHISLLYSCIWQ